MPRLDVVAECRVPKSFRVDQVAGMFDLKLEKTSRVEFHVDVPSLEEPWDIGVIVGPSGSGKSTVARQAFGENFITAAEWPEGKAVVDCFGEASIKDITHMLTSVGFSSPPSWVKPHAVLSNGEKFRCDLARALLADRPVVAFDEFTSVVDRTVAKIGSAAVSKAIRKGKIARRFVAVTCHYDIVEWLEPDWVLDMASGRLERRRLRRPEIQLEVATVHHSAWILFRRHHYLNTSLVRTAKCFVAFWGDEPVAFSSWINGITRNARGADRREHRTVVLPDFQGVGIGNRLSEFCASIIKGMGYNARSTTSHPAMMRYRSTSPLWYTLRCGMTKPAGRTHKEETQMHACGRNTGGFLYVGPAMPREQAQRYWDAKPREFLVGGAGELIEQLIISRPGCTLTYLERKTGLKGSAVRRLVDALLDSGQVRAAGSGRGADRRAYYPAAGEKTPTARKS